MTLVRGKVGPYDFGKRDCGTVLVTRYAVLC